MPQIHEERSTVPIFMASVVDFGSFFFVQCNVIQFVLLPSRAFLSWRLVFVCLFVTSSRALNTNNDRQPVNVSLCRGQGHLLANNFSMAAADLKRSVDLHATMPVAWAAWGVALFKLGTTDGQVRTEIRVSINVR